MTRSHIELSWDSNRERGNFLVGIIHHSIVAAFAIVTAAVVPTIEHYIQLGMARPLFIMTVMIILFHFRVEVPMILFGFNKPQYSVLK